MHKPLRAAVTTEMPLARLISRPQLQIGLGYVVGYVLLDWLSYIHPFAAFGITPWNPPTGLSFALILLFGTAFLPWLFVAPLAADLLVRDLALPIGAELATVGVVGVGYSIATTILLMPSVDFDPTLRSRASLFSLVVVAIVAAAVVALGYVGLLSAFGLLTPEQIPSAAVRFWVGDVIGIAVLTPFLLILFTRRRFPPPSWEMLALLVTGASTLWIVFGFAESWRFQLFYILFLPVIWTAVRYGLEGVSGGLVLTQLGLMLAIHYSGQSAGDVTAYQALMLVLAMTGLAIGVLVDEQRRTEHQLRINQEALSRAFRLGSMGEFAAAIAHEINQPLAAISNYTRAAKNALQENPINTGVAQQAIGLATEQVTRAADVVRRLRDFIRLGRSETSAVAVVDLLRESQSLCRAELEMLGITTDQRVHRDLPCVVVDAVQVKQVLVNLIRNAAEALSAAGRLDGKIILEAEPAPDSRVTLRVRDNGPGFDRDLAEHAGSPFTTTKPDGLGLGLSLARSIVEAHGGRLGIESGPTGAVVAFTLPTIEGDART